MNCEHDIVEITTVGDKFHRGLCVKCDTRFVGLRVVSGKLLEGGPSNYLTESEFEAIRDIAANRAAALGMSEDYVMADLLTAIRRESPMMLDNMGLRPGTGRIIDQLIADAQQIDDDCATSGTGGEVPA